MRYRALDADGDMTFGHGQSDFLIDTPEAVAQAASTRLRLLTGEWFLDVEEGTPYATQILGNNTTPTYDEAIRERILDTQGVESIEDYSSSVAGRQLTVQATVNTVYGATQVAEVL